MATPLPLRGISAEGLQAIRPEDMLAHLDPLLSNQARIRYIAGYDEDDLKQEFSIVALRCYRSYNPNKKKGYQGKPSSFINFILRAINNRAAQLAAAGNRQTRELQKLACAGCGWQKGVWQQGCCNTCGGESWKPVWNRPLDSMDTIIAVTPNTDARFTLEPAAPEAPDPIVYSDVLLSVLRLLPERDRPALLEALDTGKLRPELRDYLQVRLAVLYARVYSQRRQKLIVTNGERGPIGNGSLRQGHGVSAGTERPAR